jgi:hypothetical protein
MKTSPSPGLEALVAFFIPPACREHVLGDLCERYENPRQYIGDALHTIPLVIASRVRRTANAQMLLMEAFAVYLSFLAAAWWLGGAPFLSEQSGFLRLAIPAAAAVIGLAVAGAYVDTRPMIRPACGVGGAFLPETVLWAARPDLAVPSRIMFAGAVLSFAMVCAVGMQFSEDGVAAAVVSADDIPGRAGELRARTRRKNLELGGGVLVLVFLGWFSLTGDLTPRRVAGGLILADAAYLGYQVYRRRPPKALPPNAAPGIWIEFYRAELQRQLVELRGMRWWYTGPFVGALLAFALWIPFTIMDKPKLWVNIVPFVVLSLVWGYAMSRLAERTARKLQRDMDDLNARYDRTA